MKGENMKDWVYTYLVSEKGMEPKAIGYRWDDLKKQNFNCLGAEPNRNVFLEMATLLSEGLNSNFGHTDKQGKQRGEDLRLMFASVLADLPEGMFQRLRSMKNVFYVDKTVLEAYVKKFKMEGRLEIEEGDELCVVVFPGTITPEMSPNPFLLGRAFMVHELIHILTGLGGSQEDEQFVNKIARTLGFDAELDEARRYESEKLNRKAKE